MNGSEDGGLSVLALAVVAVMGWNVIADGRPAPAPPGRSDAAVVEPLEETVEAIAQAIAVAEGYFVAGVHDGQSLLRRLNNPGGLKKPALGADDLPTWLDTGLIIFPTEAMGWEALRHQIRMMLNGTSQIYDPSDTLIHVGLKYADGDANWGPNVATNLGVSPHVTLTDLAQAEVDQE
jgi:hypothetical protein